MISFEPLKNTLKSRNMSRRELTELSGVSSLNQYMTYKTTPDTLQIERICNVLQCSISDVIAWKEGEVVEEKRYKVNWDMITIPFRQLGLQAGLKPNTLTEQRRLDKSVKYSDIKIMADTLGIDVKDLIYEV